LLGLVSADSGEMRILGTPSHRYGEVAHRVGAIVESPSFFGNFSGRKTLSLLALAGGVPAARVDEVLTTVGLRDRGDDAVKGYSLGMKQRLAVASALLKHPELLILDEPANGLDPAGIHEMRTLTRDLAASGVTVLISSHILAEIELICDSVTIISRGRRVIAGPVSEVLAGFDTGEFQLRVNDPQRAVEVLTAAGRTAHSEDGTVIVGGVTDGAWITETLGQAGLWLHHLVALNPDLETVFLNLTGTTPVPGRAVQVDDSALPSPDAAATISGLPDIDLDTDTTGERA
jgi:ABC-2 type transport system ATP-binding protein